MGKPTFKKDEPFEVANIPGDSGRKHIDDIKEMSKPDYGNREIPADKMQVFPSNLPIPASKPKFDPNAAHTEAKETTPAKNNPSNYATSGNPLSAIGQLAKYLQSETYMKMAGVPEGPSLSLPGNTTRKLSYPPQGGVEYGPETRLPDTKITAREGVATAIDLLGPYLASRFGGMALEKGGEKLFARAFKRPDAIAAQEGKILPSKIFLESGKVPVLKSGMARRAEEILAEQSGKRAGVVSDVAKTGAQGNFERAMSPGKDYISRLDDVGGFSTETQNTLDFLKNDMKDRLALAKMTGRQPNIKEILQAKTATGEVIPDAAFRAYQTSTGAGYKKAVAGGLKEESERLAEEAIAGHGQKLQDANARISSMLTMLPDAQRKAIVEASKHGVTQVDAVLALLSPEAEAMKLAARAVQLPGATTVPGYLSYKAGQGLQKLAPYSPWLGVSNDTLNRQGP